MKPGPPEPSPAERTSSRAPGGARSRTRPVLGCAPDAAVPADRAMPLETGPVVLRHRQMGLRFLPTNRWGRRRRRPHPCSVIVEQQFHGVGGRVSPDPAW